MSDNTAASLFRAIGTFFIWLFVGILQLLFHMDTYFVLPTSLMVGIRNHGHGRYGYCICILRNARMVPNKVYCFSFILLQEFSMLLQPQVELVHFQWL